MGEFWGYLIEYGFLDNFVKQHYPKTATQRALRLHGGPPLFRLSANPRNLSKKLYLFENFSVK